MYVCFQCEMFMIAGKTSYAFAKNKYDCQTWNIKGILDVQEEI